MSYKALECFTVRFYTIEIQLVTLLKSLQYVNWWGVCFYYFLIPSNPRLSDFFNRAIFEILGVRGVRGWMLSNRW